MSSKSAGRRGAWLGLVLGLCVMGSGLAQTPDKPSKPKPALNSKAASNDKVKPPAEAPKGYTVAPAPNWVTPMTVNSALTVANAPVQILLWDRQTRVEKAQVTRYSHSVRRITSGAGLQKGGQIEIVFDPSFQKLVMHQLVIWREGKAIDKLDPKLIKVLHRETQLERQMVDGTMTASIVLDDLRAGDQVEWSASLVGYNPVFGDRYVDQEWMSSSLGPIALTRLRLLLPSERKLNHRVSDASVKVSETEQGPHREILFQRHDVQQFQFDPWLPAGTAFKDLVEISEYGDWAEVATWAQALFDKATSVTPSVEALAQSIEAKAREPEAQLRAALDFVQQEVRYFGTEIGANSHQPVSADAVLKQRFGDCKDKSALLTALLKRLGIPVTPVLVSNVLRDEVKQRLPSPLAFDHAIVAAQLNGNTLWLDGTRAYQKGSPESRQALRLGFGLLAQSQTTDLKPMPSGEQSLTSVIEDVFKFERLNDEGLLTSTATYHGDFAEGVREARASLPEEDFNKLLTDELVRSYPSLTRTGPIELNDVEGINAIQVRATFRTGDFWRLIDKRALGGPLVTYNLISALRLPNMTPRALPMRLASRGRYQHNIQFDFGEDSYSGDSSSRFDERNDIFETKIRYSGSTRRQRVEAEVQMLAHQLPASQWARHRDQLMKIWPRLAGSITLSALPPAKLSVLRQQAQELTEKLRRGQIKAVTSEQMDARFRLLLADMQLEADRLPPKLKAQVLLERGIQLDHLGEKTSAETAMTAALNLDPQSAEVPAALAVNALMQGRDTQAIAYADQALSLAPNDTNSRYTRAWARYFAGQFQQAQEELQAILQSQTEVERSYGSIWLYLTAQRQGGDGLAATRALMPGGTQPTWPFPVLQLFHGQVDLDTALRATKEGGKTNLGRECELYFFWAQKALAAGDLSTARRYLQKSLDTGVIEFSEYSMAQRELVRLNGRKD